MNKTKKDKEISIEYCLRNFPVRIAITDYCNLNCFFCSNEGMDFSKRNRKHADFSQLKYLVKALSEKELRTLSFTGGDPTLYSSLTELLDFLKKYNFENVFFHTNGINLNPKLIRKLDKTCTKIAVSLHSTNRKRWKKITKGTESQFKRLFQNVKFLSNLSSDTLIEIKYIPIKGKNDNEKEIKDFLELANNFGYKFKFLNFEPIIKKHLNFVISLKKIKEKLIHLGCEVLPKSDFFRGQKKYLPIQPLRYKKAKGVLIEIGCGSNIACKNCYKSNEIFITPDLEIKPCHVDSYVIPLNTLIEKKDKQKMYEEIEDSREFLATAPGEQKKFWS